MSTPATGPEPPARERILDAAEACLRRDGIRRTTAAGVAAEAGVSRAWLYRHFPDKATLLSAALIRRDEAFWTEAQHQVDGADGFAAQVAAAVVLCRAAPLGPLATELRDREPAAFAAVIGTFVDDIVPGLSWFWRAQLEAGVATGELRSDLEVAAAGEWVMRIVVSLVSVPGEAVDIDDAASIEAYLTAYLMPALV
ncbi:TetR/AcrR family transcriptional regulator [soil metagenome]